jgi:serine/threonine-protein kinase RsbW
MTSKRLHFDMRAAIASVDGVCSEVGRWARGLGLQKHCFALELLLRESLNNAVLHGSNANPAKRVACAVRLGSKWMEIRVEDQGPGFAWRKAIRRRPKSNDCHGRGLSIYRMYADAVSFGRDGQVVTLRKRIA